MHIGVIVIAVVIVVTGIYINQKKTNNFSNQTLDKQEVLSEETAKEESLEVTEIPTATNFPNTPTITPPSTSTPTINSINTNINNYKYTNSVVVSSSDKFLLLNSEDSTDAITDWYEEKIRGEGMNVTSFVKTKANDKVLNKLVGAKSGKEVSVEISKEGVSSPVKISVSIN